MLEFPCEFTAKFNPWLVRDESHFCLQARFQHGNLVLWRRFEGSVPEHPELTITLQEPIASIPEYAFVKHFDQEWQRLGHHGIHVTVTRDRQGKQWPGIVWIDLPHTREVIDRFFALGTIIFAGNSKDFYKWEDERKLTLALQAGQWVPKPYPTQYQTRREHQSDAGPSTEFYSNV